MYLLLYDVEADLFAEESVLAALNQRWINTFHLRFDVTSDCFAWLKLSHRSHLLLLLDAVRHGEKSLVSWRWIGCRVRRRLHLSVPPGEQSGQLILRPNTIIAVDSWHALA